MNYCHTESSVPALEHRSGIWGRTQCRRARLVSRWKAPIGEGTYIGEHVDCDNRDAAVGAVLLKHVLHA